MAFRWELSFFFILYFIYLMVVAEKKIGKTSTAIQNTFLALERQHQSTPKYTV